MKPGNRYVMRNGANSCRLYLADERVKQYLPSLSCHWRGFKFVKTGNVIFFPLYPTNSI